GQHLPVVQSAREDSGGTGPRPDRFPQGDRARLSVGRRNSDWIILASDRLGKLGRSGTGVAHRRRPARLPPARHFPRTSAASYPGTPVVAAAPAAGAQHSTLNRLMILAALIESLFSAQVISFSA